MIKVIIIEDEPGAMQILAHTLSEFSPEVNIVAKLSTVQESIDYFSNGYSCDIIFSDVQLPDGLSFEIFKQANLHIPVIFTTGYDQFLLMAFENNGIDYLLKPIEMEGVEKALQKYKMLREHFNYPDSDSLVQKLSMIGFQKKKTRIIVKRGMENILIRLEDVILFYTENKVVYVIDRFQKKYISDKNLSDLEAELDFNNFFRANRKFIINLDYVKGYKAFEKVKLLIEMNIPDLSHSIVISQETAPLFRRWIREA